MQIVIRILILIIKIIPNPVMLLLSQVVRNYLGVQIKYVDTQELIDD